MGLEKMRADCEKIKAFKITINNQGYSNEFRVLFYILRDYLAECETVYDPSKLRPEYIPYINNLCFSQARLTHAVMEKMASIVDNENIRRINHSSIKCYLNSEMYNRVHHRTRLFLKLRINQMKKMIMSSSHIVSALFGSSCSLNAQL